MDRSSLNALTLEKAAELLAVRREASRLVGGLVKCSLNLEQLKGYLGQAGDFAKGIWNAKPDVSQLAQPGGGDYWKTVGQESLRNALIGGAGGAGLGALKSMISGDDDMLGNAITGGLAGGALGGAGTAAYRGLDAGRAPKQSDKINDAVAAQVEQRLNDRSPVENFKGHVQQHTGFDVNKSPAAKGVADAVETVMPNANSDARNMGYGAHVLGGAAIGNATGRTINRLMLPKTIRDNFEVEAAGGGVPAAGAAAATTTGKPSLLTSAAGMARATGARPTPKVPLTGRFVPPSLRGMRIPRPDIALQYDTYRPRGVTKPQFAEQIRMAQGWRNRLPTGLGLLGAGIGAMEARKPAGTSYGDLVPFAPDATPAARQRFNDYQHYFGENMQALQPSPEFSRNYRHFMGENLQNLRDAATSLSGKLPASNPAAP